MAAVTLLYFDQFHEDVENKLHNMVSDVFKAAFTTSAQVLAVTTADARWGAGGTTNLLTNEATTGSEYVSGGKDIDITVTRAGNKITRDAIINVSWAKDVGGGFTNARYVVVYNSTDSGKRAVMFADLVTDHDLSASPINLTWHPSGLGDAQDQ